ncbi:hypothetical protein PH4a_03390 [Proteus hauseri]|nr:hypothetical protein PH4a_03390 [Proteus hauseri]
MIESAMSYEYCWFYYPLSFNSYSLIRSFFVSFIYGSRLQGDSTITMQLARLEFKYSYLMG